MPSTLLRRAIAPAAAAALIVAVAAAPASASSGELTVAEHLVGPLTFDVQGNGSLVVGESFIGALTSIPKGGAATHLVGPSSFDIAAVSLDQNQVTYGQTTLDPNTGEPVAAVLMRLGKDGTPRQLADLRAYENAHNPDAVNTYGIDTSTLTPECVATIPPFLLPAPGHQDSHPYGSVTRGDVTYVADAGANDILAVSRSGAVSTVAVLPPVTVPVTADAVAANGLDPCLVGARISLEGVPTDVEVGPGGLLYVSSLPGGPEDGSLGANGRVYTVNPNTGAVKLLAGGFAGATNVAVGPGGTVYVAELFADRVSQISPSGKVSTFASVPQPAGVEVAGGRLYVSQNVFGDGSIVSFPVP
jgi:hypothetical protein